MIVADLWNPIDQAPMLIMVGLTYSDVDCFLEFGHLSGQRNQLSFDLFLTDRTQIDTPDQDALRLYLSRADVMGLRDGQPIVLEFVNCAGNKAAVLIISGPSEQAIDESFRHRLGENDIEIDQVGVIDRFTKMTSSSTAETQDEPSTVD